MIIKLILLLSAGFCLGSSSSLTQFPNREPVNYLTINMTSGPVEIAIYEGDGDYLVDLVKEQLLKGMTDVELVFSQGERIIPEKELNEALRKNLEHPDGPGIFCIRRFLPDLSLNYLLRFESPPKDPPEDFNLLVKKPDKTKIDIEELVNTKFAKPVIHPLPLTKMLPKMLPKIEETLDEDPLKENYYKEKIAKSFKELDLKLSIEIKHRD